MPAALVLAYSPAEIVTLVLLATLLVLLGIMGWRTLRAFRLSPEEVERRRRRTLNAVGKMGDANIIDVRDGMIFYSYDVRGMEYMAWQDVSALQDRLPSDPAAVMGPVSVKYDARNPANSIILSEEWSGVRGRD
jgi:hypothetical protein